MKVYLGRFADRAKLIALLASLPVPDQAAVLLDLAEAPWLPAGRFAMPVE